MDYPLIYSEYSLFQNSTFSASRRHIFAAIVITNSQFIVHFINFLLDLLSRDHYRLIRYPETQMIITFYIEILSTDIGICHGTHFDVLCENSLI